MANEPGTTIATVTGSANNGGPITAAVQTGSPTTIAAPMSLRASLTPQRLALVIEEKKILDELIQTYLQETVDFGTIPGTKKPTLYKAGAEKITYVYECYAQFEQVSAEIDHDKPVTWTKSTGSGRNRSKYSGDSTGLYRYVYRCKIIHRATGLVVAEGYGAASTMESKYIDRPRECENTVLKMSKKRAHVDAILSGFGLSERFTQDVEDIGTAAAEQHDVDDDLPQESGPPIGSAEWAAAYTIPDAVKKALGLTVATLGACTGAQLQNIVDSCVIYLKKRPNHESTKELQRAVNIHIDALDDARVAAESGTATSGTSASPAAETPAAAADGPVPAGLPAPSLEDAVSGKASSAAVASAVPGPGSGAPAKVALPNDLPAALRDEDDDLPF